MATPVPFVEVIPINYCFGEACNRKLAVSSPAVRNANVLADSMKISVEYSGCETFTLQLRRKTRCRF
jgi:hypothetical protein